MKRTPQFFVTRAALLGGFLFIVFFSFASAHEISSPPEEHVLEFLKKETIFTKLSFPTILGAHISCGGGDQEAISAGTTIPNIAFCDNTAGTPSCKGVADCLGTNLGVSNTGYLWDPHTQTCGVGVTASQSEINSCLTSSAPPPGQFGIPTPCPQISQGATVLRNYIGTTFNIHFDSAFSVGTLRDVCVKLYETSGTYFDDFARNDPTGISIVPRSQSGCAVSGKTIACGGSMLTMTGFPATYWYFHEIAHTFKALDYTRANDTLSSNEATRAADTTNPQRTVRPHGHISTYGWAEDHGVSGCGSVWWVEEYADMISHYLHSGSTDHPPLCAGASSTGLQPFVPPYTSNAHCTQARGVVGNYNPYCATTLGTWQLHSSACPADELGACTKTTMLQFFNTHAADAVQICRRESGGNPSILNNNCLTDTTLDYSIGLFQINLLPRCGDEDGDGTPAFSYPLDLNGDTVANGCIVRDPDDVAICENTFGRGDPIKNARAAAIISGNGSSWCPWGAAAPSFCALCPHP